MFGMIWMLGIRLRTFMRRFMPTNLLLAAIFTRRGLKWGMLAVPIALIYVFAAVLCAGLAERETGWLNLLVLLFLWNAIKFAVAGPASLVWLLRVRMHEARIQRELSMPVLSDGVQLDRITRTPARVHH